MSEVEIIVKMDKHIKLKGGTYVRDLVRCKDCIHHADFLPMCKIHGMSTPIGKDDDYCIYGEKP